MALSLQGRKQDTRNTSTTHAHAGREGEGAGDKMAILEAAKRDSLDALDTKGNTEEIVQDPMLRLERTMFEQGRGV